MKYIISIVVFFLFSLGLYSQRVSWFFSEYKYYMKPDNECFQESVVSIWGWRYLRIKVFDNCRRVEISCYRGKDSTLKEKGVYYMTRDTVLQNATIRQAGTDSSRTEKTVHIIFKRVGTWKFYNKAGRIVKTVKYKEPDSMLY